MSGFQRNQSYKEGYKYYYDEKSKFVFYQKEDDTIIIGTAEHGGKLKEEDIKKLYEISLTRYSVHGDCPRCLFFKHLIYNDNFYEIGKEYQKETENVLSHLHNRKSFARAHVSLEDIKKYPVSVYTSMEKLKFNPTSEKHHKYFKIFGGATTSEPIWNIIFEIVHDILTWFNHMNIIEGFFGEDISNTYKIAELIELNFKENNFNSLDDREELSTSLIEQAYEYNEQYNEIIETIISYYDKYYYYFARENDESYDKFIELERKAIDATIKYASITGQTFELKERLYSELPRAKKLKLIGEDEYTERFGYNSIK